MKKMLQATCGNTNATALANVTVPVNATVFNCSNPEEDVLGHVNCRTFGCSGDGHVCCAEAVWVFMFTTGNTRRFVNIWR